ncbi:MAG: DUF3667 domain-containing protein [Robiginitalea sp.]|uniref:DUF3667 domain-containing protein n=2 Tax=Robiginitalea sp. TaxID=1902411 RepID=UPI003C75DF9F
MEMETKPVKKGGRFPLKFRGTECLNCGHSLELSDRYCPYCSQANSTKHLSVKDFFEEFFAEIVNLDTRLFLTLFTMIRWPGKISLDFIQGKRKTYANPFRLLLSVAVIYFLMISFSGDFERLDRRGASTSNWIDQIPDFGENINTGNAARKEILKNLDSTQLKNLDSLRIKGLEELNAEGLNVEGLDSLTATDLDSLTLEGLDSRTLKAIDSLGLKEGLKASKREKDSVILSDPRAYLAGIQGDSWLNSTLQKSQFFLTLIEKDSIYTFEEVVEKYQVPATTENQLAFGIADSSDHLIRQPGSFLQEFISTVPFAIFFFLPLFTIVLWLVYIRKNYTYTDNLVFSFHSQSFFFILLIGSFLLDWIFGSTTIGWTILIYAVFLFFSMKRFYGQGWFKTTIKYLFLNTVFVILASIAALVFLIVSALTF